MKSLKGEFPPDKVRQLFHGFAATVFPHVPVESAQYKDMEVIFFAGALSCFECFEDAGNHDNEDICLARLKLLEKEICIRLMALGAYLKFRDGVIAEKPKRPD